MKLIKILLLSLLLLNTLNADELSNAYKKEYTFLKAQKNELEKRLKKEIKQEESQIAKNKKVLQTKQTKFIKLSKDLKSKELLIDKMNEQLRDKTSNAEIISSIIIQAKEALGEYSIIVDDKSINEIQTLELAFTNSLILFSKLSSLRVEGGDFYLLDGTTAKGEIVKIGNVAAYGISAKASGALAPAGSGTYKLWNKDAALSAKALYENQTPKELNIFVYENLDKDVEYAQEKTYKDTVIAGGTIGYIILALGVFGLILLGLRVVFLTGAGDNVKKITDLVSHKLESGSSVDETYSAVEEFSGSAARVIRATIRNINKEKEHIEDIVMEAILNENSSLDKYGNFILVIAAVAPLLGLLGTVTGMIATFDIITTHGTGDPKLLSGGISEALVTTMLGLVVAIPLLLLGNLISGWANNIKDSMEHSALHIVNLFERHKVK